MTRAGRCWGKPQNSDKMTCTLHWPLEPGEAPVCASNCNSSSVTMTVTKKPSPMSSPSTRITHIPPNLVVGRCRRTLIASGSEDLEIEHPVCGGQSPAFQFHPTLARVQGSALVRDQVVQVRQAGEKRCLTPTEMMEALHHEQLPLEGVVGLV